VVTEYCEGGTLRDALVAGDLLVPLAAASSQLPPHPGGSSAAAAAAVARGCGGFADLGGSSSGSSCVTRLYHHQQGPAADFWTAAGLDTTAAAVAAVAGGGGGGVGLDAQPLTVEPDMALLRAILLQIAQGMHFLHSHGIVHGELRTDNVLLTGRVVRGAQLAPPAGRRSGGGAAAAAAADGSTVEAVGEGAAAPSEAAADAEAAAAAADEQEPALSLSANGSYPAHPWPSSNASADGAAAPASGEGASLEAGSAASTSGASGSASRAAIKAASALPGGVCVKLKDIGLCSLAAVNRGAPSLRKLAGRARPHGAAWLPPECLKGEALGRGADVYAFGILMWELLTGQVRIRGGLEGFQGIGGNNILTPYTQPTSQPINHLPFVHKQVAFQGLSGSPLRPPTADGAAAAARLAFPPGTPEWYSSLAARCWAASARQRPSFRRIAGHLSQVPPAQLAFGAAAGSGGLVGVE
jgi:hypothetical protein